MRMSDYLTAIGMTDSEFASRVTQASGVAITTRLLGSIHHKEPIALPKAQAITDFLTKEMGRPISYRDIDNVKII